MPEYDDDEDLPGAELYRNSGSARPGIGSWSRGANSGVDANGTGYEVDAVYETSGRSHAAYYEVDALYETSITAAVLCGCCLGGFCPSLGFFPALLPFLSNLWESRDVRLSFLLSFLCRMGMGNVNNTPQGARVNVPYFGRAYCSLFSHVCTCVGYPATAKPCQPTQHMCTADWLPQLLYHAVSNRAASQHHHGTSSSSPSSTASLPSPYLDPGPIGIDRTDLPISEFGARDPTPAGHPLPCSKWTRTCTNTTMTRTCQVDAVYETSSQQ